GGCFDHSVSKAYNRFRQREASADRVWPQGSRRGRGCDVLWPALFRADAPRCLSGGQDSKRRPTCRPAGGATYGVRVRDQSQDRAGARPRCAADAAVPRRRGDRMTRRLPPPWHADKFSGGYVVRDANGFAVAYVYGRSTEAEALEA